MKETIHDFRNLNHENELQRGVTKIGIRMQERVCDTYDADKLEKYNHIPSSVFDIAHTQRSSKSLRVFGQLCENTPNQPEKPIRLMLKITSTIALCRKLHLKRPRPV
mmetsp:Transcript_21759/g.31240  ORF Transcript_21759/g.31240 Transcript_21759/m.31240 type:complete len:107 (-) Transcript_21759:57-377(-)